jgi:hypothetical protein
LWLPSDQPVILVSAPCHVCRPANATLPPEELMALERTLLTLAQEINTAYGAEDAALRLVMDALAAADGDFLV